MRNDEGSLVVDHNLKASVLPEQVDARDPNTNRSKKREASRAAPQTQERIPRDEAAHEDEPPATQEQRVATAAPPTQAGLGERAVCAKGKRCRRMARRVAHPQRSSALGSPAGVGHTAGGPASGSREQAAPQSGATARPRGRGAASGAIPDEGGMAGATAHTGDGGRREGLAREAAQARASPRR